MSFSEKKPAQQGKLCTSIMSILLRFFRRPPRYVIASLVCSVGGFLQGIDTGIIGPVTVMDKYVEHFGHPTPTIHGVVVSSILLSAAVTSFLAGHVADSLGRSSGMAIGGLIFALGAVLEAGSVHLGMFIAGRLVAGIGEGFITGIMLAYICEISPARHRGVLTTGPQLFVCFGILMGFFTCYGTAHIETDLSWRLPFILLAIYAATFSAAAYILLPPSPRWLAENGKSKSEILAAWDALDVNSADQDMAEDVLAADFPVARTKKAFNVMDILSPEARSRFFMAVFLLGMQQLSGIDVSGILAIVIVAVTIPGTIWADSWGRRPNTIFGGLAMAGCMFLLGGLYAGGVVHTTGAARWIAVVTIYVFTVIFCVSWGIVLKIYAAEIQPQKTRATATSIAHGANWLTNFLVALITPILLSKTSFGAYFLFAGCLSLTALVCWFTMPETRRRTLAEIQRDFQPSYADKANSFVRRRESEAAAARRHEKKDSDTCKSRHTRCDEADEPQQASAIDDPATVADQAKSLSEPEVDNFATTSAPMSTRDLFQAYAPSHTSGGAQLQPLSMSRTPSEQTGATIPLTSEMVHLLKTYQSGVATWMDMFDYNCSYQRDVLRRCTTSELLLYAVCAFTAKTLSLLPSGELWAHPAGEYYIKALRLLSNHICHDAAHQEDTLTATMLLCSYEMTASQEAEHKHHFYGAMILISTRGVSASSVGMDLANFWIYIRHEIFVALVNEAPLQLNPDGWKVRWREGETDEAMLGNQILWLVGRSINILYWKGSNTDCREGILAEASGWHAGLPASFYGIKYGEPDDQGFCRMYFALPASAASMLLYHLLHILLYAEPIIHDPGNVVRIEYHATEIANIGVSDICQCVRNFSVQAMFFGTYSVTRWQAAKVNFSMLSSCKTYQWDE
ncbi:hypothetical protein NLG97_g1164 [Lecanicillium saksenae]|uniref:Uncharacterized protein n=1 Tax=Lecanicillium saksenae TaxID=468837 RepID=A0ACC1R4Q4_9HYPO|nr:hypothetical protein NLG97_g1164 [Lecanicillium saksenae]